MTFQPLEDVAGPSISGRTLKVHNYPDNPKHDLHTSYIMNNPEAPDRFSVILGDASHNFSLPSQNLPRHSSVRQIILLLRDAYKSLATHYKQAPPFFWHRVGKEQPGCMDRVHEKMSALHGRCSLS